MKSNTTIREIISRSLPPTPWDEGVYVLVATR
jgi:hypothetical protein